MLGFDLPWMIVRRRDYARLLGDEARASRYRGALSRIEEFGRKHPGYGYSCATMAKEAIAAEERGDDHA
jgi:hypothetical protein